MGVSVSLHHTPVIEILTNENSFVFVGINSCPNNECKNHLKEIDNKFCSECGSKIDNVMKQEEISKSYFENLTDLYNIESTAYSMCFYDYNFCNYNGDCLESEYKLLEDISEDEQKLAIEKFKEKYDSTLKELTDLEIDYDVRFRIFTHCG